MPEINLREKLFGKQGSLREKLSTVAGAAVGAVANPIRAAGQMANVAMGDRFEERQEKKQAREKEVLDLEVSGQIDVNRRQGYASDELGNVTGPISKWEQRQAEVDYENKRAESRPFFQKLVEGNKVHYARAEDKSEETAEPTGEKMTLPDFVPDEYREPIIEAGVEFDMDPTLLAAQLQAEALTATPEQKEASVKREGAVGPGQHRQIFVDEYSPDFEKRYGHTYDPKDEADNIKMTALAMRKLEDTFGSWEAALIAYNKGPSVAQQYVDDPAVEFDDDPYVKGVKERLQ